MVAPRFALAALWLGFGAASGCASPEEVGETPAVVYPEGPVNVTVAGGELRGATSGGVAAFLGIPYAAAPTGALRWKPPQAAAPWSGVREATVKGSPCPQTVPLLGDLGAEDCLFLNVHAPDPKPAHAAPVMVWIHGGGFTLGEGVQTDGGTRGERLAFASQNLVVSFNYRLGALGFLAHRLLSLEDPALPGSGNYGLQDQIAALEWVHDNIAAFGGDPGDVTIFGQSAGAMSVCALMTTPAAAGLFHHAILESGSCALPASSLAAAQAQGDLFEQGLDCTDAPDVLACMRAASVEAIRAVLPGNPSFIGGGAGYGSWLPIVDGRVVTAQPGDVLAAGAGAAVPSIVGWTKNEGSLFVALAYDMQGTPLTAAQYPQAIDDIFRDATLAADVAAHYPLASYATPGEALGALIGDAFFACPGRRLRDLLAQTAPVYNYEFDYPHPAFQIEAPVDLGAYHASEVQFVFGHPAALFVKDFAGAELALSQSLMGSWGRFAASGDPNGAGAVVWPRYDASQARKLAIDTTSAVVEDAPGNCAFWATVPYRAPLPEPL